MRTQDFDAPASGGPQAAGQVELAERLILPGFVMRFGRNEEIFGEGEEADFVYRVVAGVVRTTRFLADGRRRVCGFHLPGELFGVESGGLHRFSAEAVGECQIALVRQAVLVEAVERRPAAAHALWAASRRDLERLQEHMVLLGRRSAAERVGGFLLEMAERAVQIPTELDAASGRVRMPEIDLPMSRLDIADYLGLTIETVSRTFTQFERARIIGLPTSRHVVVRDRQALADAQA
ncbi:transcriptional regulator [Caulobacter sp. CCUG 60055]|uniref:helix-turn-helix domain-containing protein n=1 Tax=Caulobacter sp. CCUG 60055 TaxID=2100090 RepID=UPI001FA74ED9|nr:helix-turn-helix domain-containing protein [Caulobacter sp. CCUG 60055]MCI3179222.1 transcriptional regulator [Caulobacter sp. CCUG 60055]